MQRERDTGTISVLILCDLGMQLHWPELAKVKLVLVWNKYEFSKSHTPNKLA